MEKNASEEEMNASEEVILSDFDDGKWDDELNDEWEKKREERIDVLRQNVLRTIAVRNYDYASIKIKLISYRFIDRSH